MEKKNEKRNRSSAVKEVLSSELYIRQPYPITAMQADLSRQQIRILVGMVRSIQDGVQKMFDQRKNGEQMVLFSVMDNDKVNIDFKFSDVADRPDAYRNVEVIAKKFMQMVFRYEDKENGEITLTHFVDKITYPRNGSKRDKIRFSFTMEQAKTVFNFAMYSRYMLSVVAEAESKHTARIYMLITSARGFERDKKGDLCWYVSYEELRRMLGCDEKDDYDRWYRKSQKLYKHFKSNVLRVAERELKRLFDIGKSDCWFEFKEKPVGFSGEPKSLKFVLHMSEDEQGKLLCGAVSDKGNDNLKMEVWG